MKTDSEYAHRRNSDGSIDSICPRCYRTVASVKTLDKLAELAEAEKLHVCDEDHISAFLHETFKAKLRSITKSDR